MTESSQMDFPNTAVAVVRRIVAYDLHVDRHADL
jgi:hypothetical protein